jgi:hypothetical protein
MTIGRIIPTRKPSERAFGWLSDPRLGFTIGLGDGFRPPPVYAGSPKKTAQMASG